MLILVGGAIIHTTEEGNTFLVSGVVVNDILTSAPAGGAGRWFDNNKYKIMGAFSTIVNPYNFRIKK